MKRLKSIVLVVSAAVVSVGYLLTGSTSPSVEAQGSAALSIVPKKNYTIEPGKTVNDTLLIRNLDSSRKLFLSLRTVDFTFTDDGGTPKLMLAEDAPQTLWSLRPHLKLPESVTIEPGASKTIDMSVTIPKSQGGGSLYSAIVYSSSSSEGGNVGLSASGVTLVFTEVPGPADEKLRLEKLGAYDSIAKKYIHFTTQEPHRIAYTIENQGNVTARPVGSITLKSMFGKEVKINDINPNQSLALIGQTRTFETCIKLKKDDVKFNGSRSEAVTCAEPQLWPGYYKVTLDGFYGRNGNDTQELLGTSYFWYLPWWFVAIVAGLLLIVSYHVWKIVRYIRRKGKGGAPTGKHRRK